MKCEDMYVYHALCVWLSLARLRKHVVFGRVVAGMEVVRLMENAITDPQDKPYASVTVADCGQLVCAHRNQPRAHRNNTLTEAKHSQKQKILARSNNNTTHIETKRSLLLAHLPKPTMGLTCT